LSIEGKHLTVMTHLVTWALLLWFASTAKAQVDGAVLAAQRLPVVEQRLNDHDRRIERLEALDGKLDSLAEDMAGVMVELRRR